MSDNYKSVQLPNGFFVRKVDDYQYEVISPAKIIYRIGYLDLSASEPNDSSMWHCDCQIHYDGLPCKHIKMLLSSGVKK